MIFPQVIRQKHKKLNTVPLMGYINIDVCVLKKILESIFYYFKNKPGPIHTQCISEKFKIGFYKHKCF